MGVMKRLISQQHEQNRRAKIARRRAGLRDARGGALRIGTKVSGVQGQRQLLAALRALGSSLSAKYVKEVLLEYGNDLAEAASSALTAVSEGDPSHGAPKHLKESIGATVHRDRNPNTGIKGYQARISPAPANWYGHFIEYGFTDQAGEWHEERPFLRPTFDARAERYARGIERDLWTKIRTTARNEGRKARRGAR